MYRYTLIFSTFLIIFFIIGSKILQAAGSDIKGKVSDANSGEALLGANVVLIGTSIGAATDANGNYTILNVPSGTYKLRASYLGYKSKEVSVTIKENTHLVQNFKLEPVGVESKTVVVTAQASGQNQAINQQLSSNKIVNVVSAAKLQELPDANAAESLGRLPGVSVLRSGGEANEVVIRGMAPKFNRILVNGVQLTSSNPNNESVDLSMISSNMLESMEVIKTVTPDMNADVIGGVVNLELREARIKKPGVPVLSFVVQGGYNGLSNAYNKYNNYKYVGSLEDRFLDNKLGIFVQADVERKNLTSNQFGAAYENDGNLIPLYFTDGLNLDNIPRDRQRYDGAFVLDYKLPDGTIKFSNFLSSGTTDILDRGEYFGIQGTNGSNIHNYSLAYSRSTLSVIVNALHLQYQLPIFHVNAVLSHSYTETKDPNDWNVIFQQQSAGLTGFTGKINLNPIDIQKAANNNLAGTFLNSIANTSSFSGARALTASLDLEANTNISDEITSVFKFGGMYNYQRRLYTYNTTGTQGFGQGSALTVDRMIEEHFPFLSGNVGTTTIPMSPFVDKNYNYGKFLDGNYSMVYPLNFGLLSDMANFLKQNSNLFFEHPTAGYFIDRFNSTTNNYIGNEYQSALYAMATIQIGPQITIIPGVRYQNLRTTYTGARGVENTQSSLGGPYNHYDTTLTVNHGFWLPDISLKYKPFTWFDVRLSYTNTLAYPDYVAIIPRIDVSLASNIYYNNYQLVPSRSSNYDINFSFDNNTIGLFTIGGYYKKINNMIFSNSFTVAGTNALPFYPPGLASTPSNGTYTIYTYINDPNPATVYGIELDWQTHFWYLPWSLSGLVLDVNYTRVFSKEKYPHSTYQKVPGTRNQFENIDDSYTTDLLYQPNNIANLSLGYDYEGFSVRISMIYQDKIFTGVNFWPQLRTNTLAYTRWDLSAKQDLPWFGIQVYGDVSNLNNENDILVIQAPTGVPQAQQNYGLTADLGLRLKL